MKLIKDWWESLIFNHYDCIPYIFFFAFIALGILVFFAINGCKGEQQENRCKQLACTKDGCYTWENDRCVLDSLLTFENKYHDAEKRLSEMQNTMQTQSNITAQNGEITRYLQLLIYEMNTINNHLQKDIDFLQEEISKNNRKVRGTSSKIPSKTDSTKKDVDNE